MDCFLLFIAPYLMSKAFIFAFMSAAGFALILMAYRTYLQWRKTQKPTEFSGAIFQGSLALLFLSSVYPLFVSTILNMNTVFSVGIYRAAAFLALIYFLIYISLPKMLFYYRKLKTEKKPLTFTLMCFFSVVSFYCISVFFILILNLAISAL